MRCVDVNVLVYAHRRDLPECADYSSLLERWANDTEPLGLPDIVLSGFVTVISNRRIFAAQGNDIADSYLAAYAVENSATWLSADRGFARFARLRWLHPLDE